MTNRSIRVDIGEGGDVDIQLARVLRVWLGQVGGTARTRAQQIINEELNDQSGKLRTGTNFEVVVRSGVVWLEFYNNEKHAAFHEYGTGIYGPKKKRIYPKNGPVLAWEDPHSPFAVKKGKYKGWVFAKSVRGVPAKRFMHEAIEFAIDQEKGRVVR